MAVRIVAKLLLLAAVFAVVAVGHCQAFAEHTGFSDPCTTSAAVIPVAALLLVSFPLLGHSLIAPMGLYRLQPIDPSSPPPED